MSRGIPPDRWAARLAAAAALSLGLLAVSPGAPGAAPRLAEARAEEEGWLVEFEAVCARTQDAMTLSDEELHALVGRCDQLKPKIEGLDPSRRKVWSKRLQQCRDLYQFVLDARVKG
ncbi:MAG TPA: hypothetical protein VF875_02925 [Anaeromyxobacter sp.]